MYSFTLTAPLTSRNLSLAAHFHGLKTEPWLPQGYISLTVRVETAVNRDLSGAFVYPPTHHSEEGAQNFSRGPLRVPAFFFTGGEIDLFMSCQGF